MTRDNTSSKRPVEAKKEQLPEIKNLLKHIILEKSQGTGTRREILYAALDAITKTEDQISPISASQSGTVRRKRQDKQLQHKSIGMPL
jgi:hypothetical protein